MVASLTSPYIPFATNRWNHRPISPPFLSFFCVTLNSLKTFSHPDAHYIPKRNAASFIQYILECQRDLRSELYRFNEPALSSRLPSSGRDESAAPISLDTRQCSA